MSLTDLYHYVHLTPISAPQERKKTLLYPNQTSLTLAGVRSASFAVPHS